MRHNFVEYLPEPLEDGVLYISIYFSTVVHLCCCGCGSEVVTPLSPDGWQLTYDGKSISIYPSIGNWSLPCQSHYWIRNGEVQWARQWSQEEIDATVSGRERYNNDCALSSGLNGRKGWQSIRHIALLLGAVWQRVYGRSARN